MVSNTLTFNRTGTVYSSRDMVREGPRGGYLNPVLVAAPEDGSCDGIEFRRLACGHIPAQAGLVAREL